MTRARALLTALLLVGMAGLHAATAEPSATPAAKAKTATTKAKNADPAKSKAAKSATSKSATSKTTTAKSTASPSTAKAATAKSKAPASAAAKAPESKSAKGKASKSATAASAKGARPKTATAKSAAATASILRTKSKTAGVPSAGAEPAEPTVALTPDLEAVRQAIVHARAGRTTQATEGERNLQDPVARKLVEWAILRSDNNGASAARYTAFINANPSWPSVGFLRRRAEAMMWTEQPTPGSVRAFFAQQPPVTTKGSLTLARALLAGGDRAGAQAQVREAWHNDSFGGDLEAQVLATFGNLITDADHKARMDMRLYAEDVDAGLRNSNRLSGAAQMIAKARVAVLRKSGNAKAALDAVPSSARNDLGYIFSLAQWLRRANRLEEAGEMILSAPRDPSQAIDTDQWWVERRLAARNMLDLGDPQKAYRIARDAVPPKRENYRAEHQFTAGWIALRFLNDPATAQTHFALIGKGTSQPITLARAHYWQGRAFEAQSRGADARAHYQAAAQHPTAYYGQLAGAKLGLRNIALRSPPQPAGQPEVVRAIDLLYAVGQRDMVAGAVADLGDRSADAAILAALGEIAARNNDARAMLLLGKAALGNGLPLEHYAFPTIGMPNYHAIGPAVEKSLVYAIARQESTFSQRIVSSARAMGLMQVTPAAGRHIARKFNVAFNERRLLSDPVYNVQIGAAELGELISDLRGSYVLTFVGYNAGRGRVRDWIARYGDPRDPRVDPVDWVERIPFSETRNYVQRVMENMQVYRIRFGGGDRLMIEADLRRGSSAN